MDTPGNSYRSRLDLVAKDVPRVRARAKTLFICLLLCCTLIAQQSYAFTVPGSNFNTNAEAAQIAEILGVKPQVDRISQLQSSNDPDSQRESSALKSLVFQRVLIGYLEVRRACDKNDRELSYTFNVMQREQRRQDLINQFFTLANFAQLGTLYTLEPFLRLNHEFRKSAICTQSSSGVGLLLPIASILQQKTATARHTTPPPVMRNIDGGPVDASGLPPYVDLYLSSVEPGSVKTRKQEMFALWKSRYGVDASKKENLCSLIEENGKSKPLGMLSTRTLLLWSLRTYILQMDHSLLALVQQVEACSARQQDQDGDNAHLETFALSHGAVDAARLLKIQNLVAQLVTLNKSGINSETDQYTKQRLETQVLERILSGALEVRVAADQVDAEINYANDVQLAELMAKRGKALLRNYETNFIQAGTFGSIAGLLYLKHYSKAGNQMFVITGGIGTALSIRALLLMRGGHRPIDTNANSLLDVFNLPHADEYRFSPLMAAFLNSAPPDSKDRSTRGQALLQYWQEHKCTTIDLTKQKNLIDLAGAPPAKYDTIHILTNRITMLHALLAHIEMFDTQLLDLLHATESASDKADLAGNPGQSIVGTNSNSALSPAAIEAVNLLGMQSQMSALTGANNAGGQLAQSAVTLRLLLLRRVLTGALDVRATADVLDSEISYEFDVLGRMTRSRDHIIALTNNANFFQLNGLAMIIDGKLGESGSHQVVHASNVLNIVSGFLVGGLALMTVLEQRGGGRPLPANPNMVGQCLGISPPAEYRFSPTLWKFINEPPPGSSAGQSRVQLMLSSWKQCKTINFNMDKQSNREKVAAYGPAHSQHSETIKLLKNRLNMLFDVRNVVGLFDEDLDDLLRAAS